MNKFIDEHFEEIHGKEMNMNKLQLVKIALLTALLVEEVRNASKEINNYKHITYKPKKRTVVNLGKVD